MPMIYTGRWKEERRQRTLEQLDRVGIADLVDNGKTIVLVTHERDLAGRILRVQEVRAMKLITGDAIDERLMLRV